MEDDDSESTPDTWTDKMDFYPDITPRKEALWKHDTLQYNIELRGKVVTKIIGLIHFKTKYSL